MKFIIDDANVDAIQAILSYYPVDGVTTNPSILAKENKNPFTVLREIKEIIGNKKELHVQVISQKAEDMVLEGCHITKMLGQDTYVKVPVTEEGLSAIQQLFNLGIRVTATAIYTPMQGYLASKAGASYAAPYVNRIDNLGMDGVQTAKDIHDIFKNNGCSTEVLAASFKNSWQVLELCKYGIGAATISTDVVRGLIKSAVISSAIDAFTEDFEQLCGKGKTMINCE